jgi:hypothetical protein
MDALSASASDDEVLGFIDGWAALLEREDYASAFAYTDHDPARGWTPDLMREAIKDYGESRPNQKVTVRGVPSDITQRKEINRSIKGLNSMVGEIWYDLNIDGIASDLTATFDVIADGSGLKIRLNDIHVM